MFTGTPLSFKLACAEASKQSFGRDESALVIYRDWSGTFMQTAKQLWVQLAWELEHAKRDLEPFLTMSQGDDFNSARPMLASRLRVVSARLKLFAATLDQEVDVDPSQRTQIRQLIVFLVGPFDDRRDWRQEVAS
jgi:hypothetical protein